jgi:hypothetical protein
MSRFFSFILQPDLVVRHAWWTNSHTDVVDALGLPDEKLNIERRFLRGVCPDGDVSRYVPDEDDPDRLPTWYTDNENGYREAVAAIVVRVMPYRAKRAPLDADYRAKRAPLDADYEAKCGSLYADYEAIPGAVARPSEEIRQ